MKHHDELQKTLLTPAEASALFNVSLRTIYFWYRTGNIRGINLNGKCLRIFSKSIYQFLRSRKPEYAAKKTGGRGRNGKTDKMSAPLTRQRRQIVQRCDDHGESEMSSEGPGPEQDAGMPAELTPAEREMLRTLGERAEAPGYHDWAGLDFRK